MESSRTTIVLEKGLYRQAKRLALKRDKTLKSIIEEALRSYLRENQRRGQRIGGRPFRVYAGRVRGQLRRENIYRNILK